MTNVEDRSHKGTSNRRSFLRTLAGAAGATLAFTQMTEIAAKEIGDVGSISPAARISARREGNLTSGNSVSALERMRAELERALEKKPEDRHWIMVIDLRKCVGCHACTISCVAENRLPPGVVYRPVLDEEIGTYPNVARKFLPKPCMQCDEPPCTPVCPVSATYKNDEGVVVIDYDQCIGCRYCITACPYASRTFDFGHFYNDNMPEAASGLVGKESAESYERAAAFEYGENREREGHSKSPAGNVRKCHFCLHRIKEGMLPSCVTTCIGVATFFGDSNDPDSLVSELTGSPNVMRLKEDMGTDPRVYYLT